MTAEDIRLAEVDHHDHEAPVALDRQTGTGPLERTGHEVRFEVALPENAGTGSALGELLRAVAAGLLAPARLLTPRGPAGDG